MKLQIALDRISLPRALERGKMLAPYADIIEAGTSLVKDYGMEAYRRIKRELPETLLLGDLKTIDEGAYEFRQGFANGADVLTVMGAASRETLEKCNQVTETVHKEMMIDLLECTEEKIRSICDFPHAIYCLHTSVDAESAVDVNEELLAFRQRFPSIKRIAVAGGIKWTDIRKLKAAQPEVVIVGSAITHAENCREAAMTFRREMRQYEDR